MTFRLPSLFPPRFDWLQVEVSSCCNAACTYCPHTLFANTWQSRLMPVEAFRALLPILPRVRLVYLQGWGEPFLNPNFFEFVRMAKNAGCQVGATTNGMLLDEAICLRLVQEGVDIIAFTLAGADEQNDDIRLGTSLEKVLKIIRLINRIKQEEGSPTPNIHIAYMLLRSQVDVLPGLPGLLAGLGISQVTISTLDFVGHPAMVEEAILPQTEDEFLALRSQLDMVVEAGRQVGMEIHYQLASPSRPEIEGSSAEDEDSPLALMLPLPDFCTENVQRAAFVSADGQVSPCVFMNIPVSAATCIVSGEELPYRRRTFGACQDAPLQAIWRSPAYSAFRSALRRGNPPAFCRACPKPRLVRSILPG